MDKSRMQFEEEFQNCNSLDVDDPFRIWDEINDYYYLETRQAWFWWQASRESLINNLEPVGYISKDGFNSLSENSDAITSSKQQYNKVIPLYKLD